MDNRLRFLYCLKRLREVLTQEDTESVRKVVHVEVGRLTWEANPLSHKAEIRSGSKNK